MADTFLFGNKEFAVRLTANQWCEGTFLEVRVIRAPKPYITTVPTSYPPRNFAGMREATRARELGLQVEVPAPIPVWDGPIMEMSRFSQVVEAIWEERYFSPEEE